MFRHYLLTVIRQRGGTNAEQPRSTSFGAEFIINITDYLQGLVSAYVEITVVNTGGWPTGCIPPSSCLASSRWRCSRLRLPNPGFAS